jgi:hypothetical protein
VNDSGSSVVIVLLTQTRWASYVASSTIVLRD